MVLLSSTTGVAAGDPTDLEEAPYDVPNDPHYPVQWNLEDISVLGAWKVTKGETIEHEAVVAVLDSGVQLDHPELAGQLLPGRNFTAEGGPTDLRDLDGHGTHVSGIIAARANNGIGIAGVAPHAKVLPVKVCDVETCGIPGIAEGIRWAADAGADVINLSLGQLQPVGRAVEAIEGFIGPAVTYAWERGAVVVAAAGNNTLPLCSYPAYFPQVICVGATERDSSLAKYSSFDAARQAQYLVAPGGTSLLLGFDREPLNHTCDWRIWSLWAAGTLDGPCTDAETGGYIGQAGTSMAAPHVAGVAALLASLGLDNDQIVQRILATTDDLGPPGHDPVYGHGLLNATRAVSPTTG